MKKYQLFLLTMIVCLFAFCGIALADTLGEDITALYEADRFDTQLAVLDKIASENAAVLENGGWEYQLNVSAAPGFPEGIVPENWENATFENAFRLTESMQGRKFIALYYPKDVSEPEFAGDLLARFPADMRAGSLDEAEYALIVREYLVPSGYEYIPPAPSFHRDYEAYAVDIKTGEITRFWTCRNEAKPSGNMGELNGDRFTQQEIWSILRPKVFGEIRYKQQDGAELLFSISGDDYILKGYAGNMTDLDLPASVNGFAVVEIADHCFKDKRDLKSVKLPEGLKRIADGAFENCSRIERIELPNTLESIGSKAFSGCYMLTRLVVGDKMTELPSELLLHCNRMACCYFPADLTGGLSEAGINKSAVIYAPEGSYALQWAAENGCDHFVCDDPGEMPDFEYIREGDFEFLIFRGEAQLTGYLGKDADVIVPGTVDDVPVTRVRNNAFQYKQTFLQSVTLPESIRTVSEGAFKLGLDKSFHLFVPNPETSFVDGVFELTMASEKITIVAPEGSLAERYVIDKEAKWLVFEAWADQ